MNRVYRGKDKATDVLSFKLDDVQFSHGSGKRALRSARSVAFYGEILLCLAVLHTKAKEEDVELLTVIKHRIVHGILHILGYDHHRVREAKKMEQLEAEILDELEKNRLAKR